MKSRTFNPRVENSQPKPIKVVVQRSEIVHIQVQMSSAASATALFPRHPQPQRKKRSHCITSIEKKKPQNSHFNISQQLNKNPNEQFHQPKTPDGITPIRIERIEKEKKFGERTPQRDLFSELSKIQMREESESSRFPLMG